jgi:hypothetical protein
MKPDEFEQKLSRQPLRPVPAAWREEVLSAAREAEPSVQASHVTRHSWLATFNHRLSTLFWPHPIAWAGLAAVWICIGVLNFSTRDASPRLAEKSVPPSPEMLAELRQQQQMFAELVGPREEPVADRSKTYAPRPRTWRVELLAA